jgi:hypothetical protein
MIMIQFGGGVPFLELASTPANHTHANTLTELGRLCKAARSVRLRSRCIDFYHLTPVGFQ